MTKIRVEYSSGESRLSMDLVAAGRGVDYMLAVVPQDDDPEDIELYAEAEPVEGDETATYEDLAAEILCQAVAAGVDVTRLDWHMDPPMLTTAQAADILGLSEIRARQLCQEGRMGRKIGDAWVITPDDLERNRVRRGPGQPRKNEPYERRGEWSGYTVKKAAKGFVVDCWSRVQGTLTDDKYLLPYGKASGGYEADADLSAQHNDLITVGMFLGEYQLRDHPRAKILRKGHIVQ